ncbi:uncharacterized protein DUF2782 [Inmirania thermothiophila]|uniref:Uncharacterized protein DUF2782 n=1 Tax=Inmirania thermothiophila TaxID=1750597 RepID=A0A3N1Y643_9GAMM|nr:uncharacterized protein DUF2782 [Inmirania thermothiophila]
MLGAPPSWPEEPPPPLPAGAEEAPAAPRPEVTIRPSEGGVVEEYRIRGRLYMVRVVPRRGRPYFLIDTDGDGELETRRFELAPEVLVPGWVIRSW